MILSISVDGVDGQNGSGCNILLEEMNAITTCLRQMLLDLWPGSVKYEDIQVSVEVMNREAMKKLNRQYRSCDEPTDVLSFPLWEEDCNFRPPEGWAELPLGDIVICPDVVIENASGSNREPDSEIILMLVHGVLHLMAWDHDTPKREELMWREQDKYKGRILEILKSRSSLGPEKED